MRWLFMWQDEDLNMAYEIYSCQTEFEARERFEMTTLTRSPLP